MDYFINENGTLVRRTSYRKADPCQCRVVTVYVDDVPYDREILCRTCSEYERRDTE